VAKWTEGELTLAETWYTQALRSEQLHIAAHHRYGRLNFIVGIPVVVVSATIGTTFFASLGKVIDTRVAVAVGLISLLSSVLAALQTFLRLAEKSEQHRISAARYRNTAREIQHVLAMSTAGRGDAVSLMEAWRKEFASLAENAPAIPPLKGDSKLVFERYPEGTSCAAILTEV
jgi:hypothetical protein